MLVGLPNCGGSAADRTVTGNLSTSCSFQKGTSNELGGVIGSWDHMVTMWWEDHALYNIIWGCKKIVPYVMMTKRRQYYINADLQPKIHGRWSSLGWIWAWARPWRGHLLHPHHRCHHHLHLNHNHHGPS